MIEDAAELWDDFKRETMPKVRDSIKELKAEYPDDWQRERRTEYLKGRMEDVVYRTLCLMSDYDRLRKTDNVDSRLFVGEQIQGGVKTIQALQREIISLRKPKESFRGGVSEDEIMRARQAPWEQLIEVNRAGMAVCPFHADRDPSFHVKNGFGYCFGCQWKGDQIAFLMERDGLSFVDAVKQLQ